MPINGIPTASDREELAVSLAFLYLSKREGSYDTPETLAREFLSVREAIVSELKSAML